METDTAIAPKPSLLKKFHQLVTDGQGNMRWQASLLCATTLLVVCSLVATNVGTVVSIRQSLLHNHPDGIAPHIAKVRAALSGSDALRTRWDDVKVLKVAKGTQLSSANFQAQSSATSDAADPNAISQPQKSSSLARSACLDSCSANGYSAALAGEAAAKACVDVCLSQAGSSTGDDASSAEDLLNGIATEHQSGAAVQPSKVLHGSLQALVAEEGVKMQNLPKDAAHKLVHGEVLDNKIRHRVRADNAGLRAEWLKAVREGQTIEAARYMNSKKLLNAVVKAVKATRARIDLDSALVHAASKYERTVGSEGAATPEARSARKSAAELRRAEADAHALAVAEKAAAQVAGINAGEWSGDTVGKVESLLSAPTFSPPAAAALARGWADDVAAAAAMPAEEAAAVRQAAMNDGRLGGMLKGLYVNTRKELNHLAADARESLAARAANAELVEASMRAAGRQEADQARLLAAERRYVATVANLRGAVAQPTISHGLSAQALKGDPGAKVRRLGREVSRDVVEAHNLYRAAAAADAVLRRFGPAAPGQEAAAVDAERQALLSAATKTARRPTAAAQPAQPARRAAAAAPPADGEEAVRLAAAVNPHPWSATSLTGGRRAPAAKAAVADVTKAAKGWWF